MWFKLIFGMAFVIAVMVAARTAKSATKEHGGSLNQLASEVPGLIWLRGALGLVFYFALMVWLFWSASWPSLSFSLPAEVRWLAAALLVPVLVFFAASFRAIGTNYRGGVGLYENHSLVTSGPYRHIRHPIYVAFITIMVLVLALSANWLLGVAGILLVVSIAAARMPIEERELRERFGPAWETYTRNTGRMFPRLGRRP